MSVLFHKRKSCIQYRHLLYLTDIYFTLLNWKGHGFWDRVDGNGNEFI